MGDVDLAGRERGAEEEVIVRGHRLSELIGRISFAEMMFLLLRGDLATPAHARVLDALLVASAKHGIAPPSMVSRCFASHDTNIRGEPFHDCAANPFRLPRPHPGIEL